MSQLGSFSLIGSPKSLDPSQTMIIDPTFNAGRMSLKPWDHGQGASNAQAGGHFGIGLLTGATTTLAANAILAALQWLDSAHLMTLLRCDVYALIKTVFTTGQGLDVSVTKATSFKNPATSGTELAQKISPMRRGGGMAQNSLVGSLQICGATALTAPAAPYALDTNPIAQGSFPGISSVTLGSNGLFVGRLQDSRGHPPTFAANEGFQISLPTAQGATGVVLYYIILEWLESLII